MGLSAAQQAAKNAAGKELARFNADLEKFADLLGVAVGVVRKTVAFQIWDGVIEKSPVDKGTFRGSWQMQDGAPGTNELPDPPADAGGNYYPPPARPQISDVPFEVTWITNPKVYGPPLEFGHSSQAPHGMVRVTMAEVEATIDAEVARIMKEVLR
jgi:hypothetical protein